MARIHGLDLDMAEAKTEAVLFDRHGVADEVSTIQSGGTDVVLDT